MKWRYLSFAAAILISACTAQPQPDGGWEVSDIGNPLAEPVWSQQTRMSQNGPVCVLSTGYKGMTVELGGFRPNQPPVYAKVESTRYVPIGGWWFITMNAERFVFRDAINTGPDALAVVDAMLKTPADKMYLEWRERDGGRHGSGYQRFSTILSLAGFKDAYNRCRM